MGGLGQAACHEGGHGPQDHGFVAGREAFVVADGAAVLADPGECPLYHPAAGQHLEGVRVAPGDDLQGHLQAGGPAGELAGVDSTGPDQADAAAGAVQVPQQRPGGVAVLDGGGGDHHGQQQAHRVYGDVPLAAVHFFRVIPAAGGLGHGVGARTDWESITAAVGSTSRPAATRTWARSTSCSRAKVPSSRQAAKYPYTVRQGGKSAGRYRQAHQVRSTYKIASTIARADQMRGLPRRPGTSAGRCGSWGPRQFISTGLAKSAMTGIKAIYQTLTEPSSGWSCAGLAAWCLTGAGIDCRDMRVVVTGGAGFIGSHLTDAFLARGDDVTVIDDMSAGRPGWTSGWRCTSSASPTPTCSGR